MRNRVILGLVVLLAMGTTGVLGWALGSRSSDGVTVDESFSGRVTLYRPMDNYVCVDEAGKGGDPLCSEVWQLDEVASLLREGAEVEGVRIFVDSPHGGSEDRLVVTDIEAN